MILAAHALWIVASRPGLPDLLGWPRVFWPPADGARLARFGIGLFPLALERVLFGALVAALLLALAGVWTRRSCSVAAVLLYHFAPMEEGLVGMPHTSFGGLTTPVVGLFLLAFAEAPRMGSPLSWEFRWPVALTRLFFSFGYLFPLLAKLRFAGPSWFTADNIRSWMTINGAITEAPWAATVAASDALCWTVALTTLALELLFPLAVFSRRAALTLVPLAALFHVGTVLALGYFFPSLPLLLLFVEWDLIPAPRPEPEPGAAAPAGSR